MTGARIRICYSKTQAGRYLSHLDLTRAMERSFRRIKAPLAFSEGFNPHVRMAFASALAVGSTGLREYLDLDLTISVDIAAFGAALKEALPPALAYVGAREISPSAESLSAVVNLAVYRIAAERASEERVSEATSSTKLESEANLSTKRSSVEYSSTEHASSERASAERATYEADQVTQMAREGIKGILAADELWRIPRQKPGKKPAPPKEVRSLIRRLELVESSRAGVSHAEASPAITIEAELIMSSDGHLRPDELWRMIADSGGIELPFSLTVDRLALLILRDGKTFDPMDVIQ